MRKYPIEQADIDKAIEKQKQRLLNPPVIVERRSKRLTPKQQRKQKRLDREWIASRHKPLSLAEAIKRLQDDEVYAKASKHIPAKDK